MKLMVDRTLDDGRFVVTNDSRKDAPVGTIFTKMTLEAHELVAGEFKSQQVGAAAVVALTLEAVESWRKSLDAIPFGHNAAIRLSGAGLAELAELVGKKAKGQCVFLTTD